MKKQLTVLAIGAIASFGALAGNEGGNGGQSTYIGDNAYLRDIVEKNNCLWKSSALVKKAVPELEEVLSFIDKKHWFTTLKLEEVMSDLKFCFTDRRLPPLSYNNSDDLYIFSNQLFDQPAINDKGIVFIDNNLFNDMDAEHQAFLVLHEVSHELFDKKEKRSKREPRLRQFIMNLHDQYINGTDYDTFVMNLEQAKMARTTVYLEDYSEKFVKRFIGELEGRIDQVVKLFVESLSYDENFQLKAFHERKELYKHMIFDFHDEMLGQRDYLAIAQTLEKNTFWIFAKRLESELFSQLGHYRLSGEKLKGMRALNRLSGGNLVDNFLFWTLNNEVEDDFLETAIANAQMLGADPDERAGSMTIRWHNQDLLKLLNKLEKMGGLETVKARLEKEFWLIVKTSSSWGTETSGHRHILVAGYVVDHLGREFMEKLIKENKSMYEKEMSRWDPYEESGAARLEELAGVDSGLKVFADTKLSELFARTDLLKALALFDDLHLQDIEGDLLGVFANYDVSYKYKDSIWGSKKYYYYTLKGYSTQKAAFEMLELVLKGLAPERKEILRKTLLEGVKAMQLKADGFRNTKQFNLHKSQILSAIKAL